MGHVHAHNEGIAVLGQISPGFADILTPQALDFVAKLVRKFEDRRRQLMQVRALRQTDFDAGRRPDFLPQTRHVREKSWTVAAPPRDLLDRRVEITGPVERKMIINALNSGANVFMADFEDSCSPTWENMIQGQINLRDAVRRTISYVSPEGKQ
ncbi:MAG TPA: malate synthase A, partial [Burkholderiales bacterium]|nr:malate synthase A [Burkholderiales bacterium]